MKQFNGFDEAKKNASFSVSAKLPAGAYECKVLAVRFTEGQDGKSDLIELQIDVAEGEHKGFFKAQYDANTNEDKKYKGVVKIWCPTDDGTEKDGWTKNTFARWMRAFEESNNFTWAWDEKKLKGLLVGIVFGETGNIINGKEVLYTEPRFACPVSQVRDGSAAKAKFLKKNGYTGNGAAAEVKTDADGFIDVPEGPEEIPF